ncbi:hypothetical protein F503_06428 [Ophiostoma piceae UAMH 11346]|uniref:Uncharacterized protein n=1 Tax=Ophiostoma piceae (strain UAMH 11346) TaxID=1262450 RepID=S3BTH1_OPHP1|nr:hypothetical protein F503_06428 [Ophiostoma piceae UAMH 11346]
MFLHSGASLHGHEYSNKNRPPAHQQPPPLRNTLLRSAFASNSSSGPSATSTSSTTPSSSSSYTNRHSFSSFSSLSSPPASIIRSSTFSDSDGLRPARSLRANPHHRTASFSGGIAYSPTNANANAAVPTNQPSEQPVVRFHDPVVVDAPSIAALPRRALSTSTPHTPTPSGLRSRLSNKQNSSMSEDEASVSASEASYVSEHPPSSAASSKPARQQRTPRKSTTYLFAHPAPKLSRKKPLLTRIRPTLLMQLQKISLDARPLPVIDVYPSSLLVGNVTAPRFSKRFPRLFGINGELGLHDTILVQSDNYDRSPLHSESEGDDDTFEHRSLLAVFSPLRGGDHSEIVLQDGTIWTTTALPNGSFEFSRTDELGNTTIARWVRRLTAKRAPVAGLDDSHSIVSTSDPECKFIFSVIDPQSRRHPILATLTKVTLSILDRYTTVSPASGSRYPPTRAWTQSPTSHDTDTSNDEMSHDEDAEEPAHSKMAVSLLPNAKGRATLPVDEKLKSFISISSIWVALQCGWGQAQMLGMPCLMSANNTPVGSMRKGRDRQMSEPVPTNENADSTVSRGRRLSSRYSRRSATFNTSEALSTATATASDRDAVRTPLFPRKASSTGAAYVQRQKQLQQLSDTSDSERPGPVISTMTPKRRSRAFSRLSGEFSSMVSSKLHNSPSPPHAPATPEEAVSNGISRSNSLRLPAVASDLKPSRNGRAVVSAYYTARPLGSPSASRATFGDSSYAYAPATDIRGFAASETADTSLYREQEQQHQQFPSPPHQRTDQDLDHAGHGHGKWKKMSSWFKSRLSSH